MNILILATNANSLSTKYLKEACEKRHHTPIIYSPHDLYIHCSDGKGVDKLYIKNEEIYKENIDAVIPRTSGGGEYAVTIVRHLHKNMNIFSAISANGMLNASDKILTTQLLSKAKIPSPKTTFIQKTYRSDFNYLMNTVGGLPVVGKLQRGSLGQGVFMLETELAGATTLNVLEELKANLILQEFIESSEAGAKKSDIRAFVVGSQVVASMKRMSITGDFRSNYTVSKEAIPVELSEEEEKMAIKAAQILSLGVAGVDIMRDAETNKSYILEVNSCPSLVGVTKITGVDVAEKIIEYLEKMRAIKQSREELLKDEKPLNIYHKVMKYLLDGDIDYHADTITLNFDKINKIAKTIQALNNAKIKT